MKPIARVLFLFIFFVLIFAGCGSDDDDDDSSAAPDDDDVDDDSPDDDDTADDDDDDDDDSTPSLLYLVEGTDSRYGDYEGLVEIRLQDELNFIRVVKFDALTFPDPRLGFDYEVHTAWTGQFSNSKSSLISVQLKVADLINHYGDLDRTDEDGWPAPVYGEATENGDQGYDVSYDTGEGATHFFTAQETWTYLGAGQQEPIFKNEDVLLVSHEPMPQFLHDLVFFLLSEYHAVEFYDDYRDREDFKAGVHYIAQHRTDFLWYRDNPRALRVAGKWLDEISMAETMLRARSFSPTLTEKAAWFDEEMPDHYLNSLGIFSQEQYGSAPQVLSESGDGLLWTGCYLAGQVFRYLETGDQDAMDNWLRALDGLMLSHDMPQDPTTFGRAVRPHVGPTSGNWNQGAPPLDQYDWLCCGNNDMIQGLYYGYALSLIYLPDDPLYDDYRDRIAERAVMLADNATEALDGEFNEIKATWLAYLATGEVQYQQRYQQLWANPILRTYARMGSGLFYAWGISDWSGQHLVTIGHLTLWFLADATGDPTISILEEGWINGMRMNRWTQTLFPIAAIAFTQMPEDVEDVFARAVWNMREIPYPKQILATDKRIELEWSASPLPSLFWKLDYFQGGRHQGLYGVPMWGRNMHSNMWVPAPFDYQKGETDWTDGGGADYLHAYWLGRYFGVFNGSD